jgi:alkylhydroperoxidase family enzyme
MARREDPDQAALSPASRAALDRLPPNNVFRTLAHADAAFPPLMALTASLWNEALLSQRHRELAILRTSRLVDSAYEWMHHVEVARMVGISDDQINAIDVDRLEGFFEGSDLLVLRAVPYILEHRRSDDAVFDALEQALSLRELVELHLVVGLYATIAGVVTDFDVELDPRSGAFDLEHDERGPRLGT